MTEMIKIRMLAMIDRELEDVKDNIRNNEVWKRGSTTEEEAQMFDENITDLEVYTEILLELRENVEKGEASIW
jgi:uncharacterized protein involved in tellurium resistance